jgi:putative transposase
MACLIRTIRHLAPSAVILCTLIITAAGFLRLWLRSYAALAAENLFLREQLALYQARHTKPERATDATRCALIWLSHWFDWRQALTVVQPETFSRWRRQGLWPFWHLQTKPGRPEIPRELQALIRCMARDNATWGQRRIANELQLKLGLRVSPRTVCKYMPTPLDRAPGHRVPAQRWRTFVRNHAWDLIARGMAANRTRGIQALAVGMRGLLQRWRRPTVVSAWRGTPRHDTTGR